MNDYSYSEIKSMQQRAMERVREMNRTSENALEMAKKELESDEKKSFSKPQDVRTSSPIKTKHTNMPPNFPKDRIHSDFYEGEDKRRRAEHPKKTEAAGGVLDSIINEPDRALLMGLIMLLKSEGADEILMMALMYIMA